jgi:oligopeptide transport system substrate-binding protein
MTPSLLHPIRAALTSLTALLAIVVTLPCTPATAADMSKTLRLSFSMAETSFDNAFASDAVSQSIGERIIEPLLDYHYLARPVKLVPRTAAALPEVSDNGATFLFKLQQGIFFADDAAFKGKPRELIAADYAYSLKRLLDPKVKSPWQFLLDGKLVGGDEARAAAVASGKFDYDAPLAGLEVVDRYTLRIRLKATDYNFLYILAMPSTGAAAREVVEFYGQDIGAHPVGTGPYLLKRDEYKRGSLTVLVANPTYRKRTWDWTSSAPGDQALIKAMTGKPVPSVGRVEVYVIEEGQAAWLAFVSGQHDYLPILPASMTNVAKDSKGLKPEFAQKGIRLAERPEPNIWYTMFNMTDPVTGGYTPEKIALRRAISMGFSLDEQIRVIFQGDGTPTNGIVPPNVVGHTPARPRSQQYDPALARALLDRFGYIDRDGDGYRELPDGSPLAIPYVSRTSLLERQLSELWKKSMDAIGIRLSIETMKTPDMRKAAREGKGKMTREGWNADYPDAENFLQLLTSKNAQPGGENYARFQLKEFDERYEKMRLLPDGPARAALVIQMEDIVKFYAPWIAPWTQVQYYVEQPWMMGFKKHPISHDQWEFADVEKRAGMKVP